LGRNWKKDEDEDEEQQQQQQKEEWRRERIKGIERS
jgi:hypothetical protein